MFLYNGAQVIEQESVYMPGVRVIRNQFPHYPSGELTSHIVGFMGPLPDESYLDQGYARDDRVGLFGVESSPKHPEGVKVSAKLKQTGAVGK